MKIVQILTSNAIKIMALATLVTLAACGGGGGSGTDAAPVAAAPSSILTLQSSAGDLTRYANSTWISDCGIVPKIGGGVQTYQTNVFKFGAASPTTVVGSISVSLFTVMGCTGATVGTSGTVVPVSFKYIKELAVTSDTPVSAQGKADEFLITETASQATQTFTIGFLPGNLKFAGGSSSLFTASSLRYNKL
jgi:hypothetical protein